MHHMVSLIAVKMNLDVSLFADLWRDVSTREAGLSPEELCGYSVLPI
jgi:hypothetical protein